MSRSMQGSGVEVAPPRAAAAWGMLGLGLLLAVVVTLSGDAGVTAAGRVAISLVTAAAVGYGIRRLRPENPHFWWLCLAAVIAGLVAHALTALPATSDRLILIDLAYVVRYTLFVAAAVTALPRRQGRFDWASQLDAFTVATAGGIAFWYFWVSPSLRADVSVSTITHGLVFPLCDLALLVLGYRLATSGEPWRFPLVLIVAALTSKALAVLLYAAEGGPTMGTSRDALFLVPATAIGAAALHPQMQIFGAARHRSPLPINAPGVFWISVTSFAVPIVVAVHALRTGRLQEETPALLAAATVLVVIGAARSAEMVRVAGRARDRLSVVNAELGSALDELQTVLSETRGLHDELAYSATHDALTGLANRRLLRERLDALVSDRRHTGAALLFLDLDDFKYLNDSLGHEAGDRALVELGRRISEALRPGDLVARLGGDEFAILVNNADKYALTHLGGRLLDTINQPYAVGPTTLRLKVSIGAAWADLAASADDLIRAADLAMYQAKAAGKNRIEFFDPEQHDAETVGRFLLELTSNPPTS